MEELTDIREIRKHLRECEQGYCRVDGKTIGGFSVAPVSSLIRAVSGRKHHQGLSGEDSMTLLAYHALLELERQYDRILENAFIKCASIQFPSNKDGT